MESISSDGDDNMPLNEYDIADEQNMSGRLHRSYTDAHKIDSRPQLRVRFHTMPNGGEVASLNPDLMLLSSKAHQFGTVNCDGIWQRTLFSRRRKGYAPTSEEEEVNEIAQAMEGDQKLMADTIDGEILRRDALRELTKSLSVKREIKQRLTKKRSLRTSARQVSWYKSFKYSLSMKWLKVKQHVSDAMHDYTLWHKDLKDIEGIYGTSIGSYFHFLRYLFLLNLIVTIIVLGFLFVPQKLYYKYESNVQSYNNYSMQVAVTANSLHVTDDLVMEPRLAISSSVENFLNNDKIRTSRSGSSQISPSFRSLDWLTGAGWFHDSELYYGGYITGIVNLYDSNISYDMSQAYFFTVIICFIFYLIVLLFRIFNLYRVNYIDTEEDISVAFVEKVFSAWDFKITNPKSAKVKHRSIYNGLIESLQELQDEEEIEGFFKRITHYVIRFATWFFIICFLCVLGFALYILLKDELFYFIENESDYYKASLKMIIFPLVVTLLMIIIPIVFESIGRFEKYSKPRYEVYSTLIRVILLELTILVVLFVFWYAASPGLREELPQIGPKPYQYYTNQKLSELSNNTVACWESVLGEEMYRLVFIDFLVILVSVLVVDTSRKLVVKNKRADELLQEFDIARNTLHIIYNQTLLWAGIFFCPLLPLIVSIKFFIIFYLQKFNVTKNHEPLERPWRAAQTETLFYILTLISFILCFASLGFILVRGYCSPTCGPFQGYVHYVGIMSSPSEASHQIMIEIVNYLLRPGTVVVIIILLSICVYCVKNISEGRSELVIVLRKQLELEMKDRVFLQRLIEKVHRGEYMPGSPSKSVPSSPVFSVDDLEDRNLSKRTSFIFHDRKDQKMNQVPQLLYNR